jgi:hypothetical protein
MTADQSPQDNKKGSIPSAKEETQSEKMQDKAVEDTFPASDPPSSGSPTSTVGWEDPTEPNKK